MATHLTDLKCGGRTYYISHSGDTVYYSSEGRGKGSSSISGLKFRSNQIVDTSTGKPATEFQICQKMGK
jgi:hypothetical protein